MIATYVTMYVSVQIGIIPYFTLRNEGVPIITKNIVYFLYTIET